jgi:hypothetical protein
LWESRRAARSLRIISVSKAIGRFFNAKAAGRRKVDAEGIDVFLR